MRFLITLVLVLATRAEAQQRSPYEVRVAFLSGPRTLPDRVSCDRYWCWSWGGEISLSRRLSQSLAILAAAASLSPLPDSTWLVAIQPYDTSHRTRYYGGGLHGKRRVTSDIRLRWVNDGGRGRVDVSAGGGRVLAPYNMPYVVIASGIRFGGDRRFLVGGEHRSYWMRYTQEESIPSITPHRATYSTGKSRVAAPAFILSFRF